jgi:hypothetical protein
MGWNPYLRVKLVEFYPYCLTGGIVDTHPAMLL